MSRRSVATDIATHVPAPYIAALEGIAAGLSDAEVAERAGVDESAVPALVRLAAAKLLRGQGAAVERPSAENA